MATGPPHPAELSPTRPSHLRQINAHGLLQLLRANSPCSRADLVRSSGLTAPTVAAAVTYLKTIDLVEFLGDGESSGGRPPELIGFNAKHAYVAGIDIGGTRLRMMLADLNGRPAAQWSTQLSARQKSPRALCTLVNDGLRELCGIAGVPLHKVLHLTAGAPGITNVDRGTVISAPNLIGWDQVPLRSMLEVELDIDVIVENDTNLAAVGEHWQGSAKNIDDFIFIAMGTGVGAGIFLGGRIHRGSNWSAGEIGYLPGPGVPSAIIRTREIGQLEHAIGGAGIEDRWRLRLKQAKRHTESTLNRLHASQIFDLAQDGDPLALDVLTDTAEILAHAIATIGLLFNPGLVVLGGGIGSHDCLCRTTQAFVVKNEFARPLLRSSALGTQAQLFGAVSLSLAAVTRKLLV